MAIDEEEIYQEHILDHYEDPYHRGKCESCTHCHQDSNPLCGDVIRMELQVDDGGKFKEVYFDGHGCCISQAAASMLVERFDGRTVEEVRQFTAEDMITLFGVRLTPNRQKCCLLPWRVLQAAVYSPVQSAGACRPQPNTGDCPDFRVNENGTVPLGARTDSVDTEIRTGPNTATEGDA